MKNILILSLTLLIGGASGCTTSLDVLIAEAKQCDIEQRADCWVDVNKKLIVIKRAEEIQKAKEIKCPKGTVMWCDGRKMRNRWCDCKNVR